MTDSGLTFTQEQLLLIEEAGSQYVLACPGAGKTQAIAERYVRRPNRHPRKGMALLSFTNAAADEAAVRCSSKPDLLLCPNFVGTIDKFINRFIVGPVWTSQKAMAPQFIDVWSQLPHTSVKSKDFWASLDWFAFDRTGAAQLLRHNTPSGQRTKFDKLAGWQLQSLERQAEAMRRDWIEKGYISAEASRKIALDYLDDSELRKRLAKLLTYRFFEVVVDEVQDCSDEDVQILELIENTGIHLVLVGDPDQAIYEFRGRSENSARKLELLAPPGERLNGNFRSTPAICSMAGSLRASDEVDIPVGPNAKNNNPVLLLKYDKSKSVATAKMKVAEAYGIDNKECIVLAHGRRHAAACAGGSASELVSDARLARIAIAMESLQVKSSDGVKRRDALRDLIVCLHEASLADYNQLTSHEFCEKIELSEREYHAKVLRLVHAVNFDRKSAPSEFRTSLVSALQEHGFYWVRAGAIQKPRVDKWSNLPSSKQPLFDFSTIHNYKGLQKRFVTVVIPDSKDKWQPNETGVGQWLTNVADEPRRVLYVGVTRAEELLMLAVHDSEYDGVYQKLMADGVPFNVVDLATGQGLRVSDQLF